MPQSEQFIVAQRPSGSVFMRCIGMQSMEPDVVLAIQSELEQFVDECHSVFICHVSAIKSMQASQGLLAKVFEDNEPVSITTEVGNGSTRVIRTGVLGREATELFAIEGKFEKLQARSLVMAIFTHWDSVTRPRIASRLGVSERDVESQLMGEWRLLRNWLVHRDGDAEEQYYRKAETLARLLDSRPGEPGITTQGVLLLMEQLRSLTVIVNPEGLEPFIQFPDLRPEERAKLWQGQGPGGRILPLWHEGLSSAEGA